MAKEIVVYRGVQFLRDPESEHRHLRVYYWPGRSDKDRGVKSLHVEVYKNEVGEIPSGWHIHHINGDPLDNRPENLEALTPADHVARHFEMDGAYHGFTDAAHMKMMQDLARAWHSTPEGLKWHSENAKRSWDNREREAAGPCAGCGTEVLTFFRGRKGERWCSTNCRIRAVGNKYRPEKNCPICETPFKSKSPTCSRKCGNTLRLQNRLKSP